MVLLKGYLKKTQSVFFKEENVGRNKMNHINSHLVGRWISSVSPHSSFDSLPFVSVHCPYDTESILMIVLTSILILEAALSLSGVIESSQLLCCAVSVSFIANYYMAGSVSGPNPALRRHFLVLLGLPTASRKKITSFST